MKTSNELMMESRSRIAAIHSPPVSTIKSILFVVHDDDGLEMRFQCALSLARACSAHLQLLHVIPVEAYTVVDTYGGTFASGEIVEALEEHAAGVRARLEHHLGKEDVGWSYEVTTSPVVPELLKNAAFADLIFVGRQPHWHEFSRTGPGLLGELVCNSRTPLCIPGEGADVLDPFGNAVIAWNGSIEAANAVRASIGLLRMASSVRIVRYTEDTETSFPDTHIVEYLSRHGISAVLDTRTTRTEFCNDLVEYARVFAADYLVIGGYSHSRAGEFLFGGVTRELIRDCPVTLVMAH